MLRFRGLKKIFICFLISILILSLKFLIENKDVFYRSIAIKTTKESLNEVSNEMRTVKYHYFSFYCQEYF